MTDPTLRRYHAAVWDEPLVMELGAPGPPRRRASAGAEPGVARAVGDADEPGPGAMRRAAPPALPELSRVRGAAPLPAPRRRRRSG